MDLVSDAHDAHHPERHGHDGCHEPVYMAGVPLAINWVSIDQYQDNNRYGQPIDNVKATYGKLFERLPNDQKVLVVPEAYGSTCPVAGNTIKPNTLTDENMIVTADRYLEWARTEQRIIGIIPWHWFTSSHITECVSASGIGGTWGAQSHNFVGVLDLPRVKAKWSAIGKKTRERNPRGTNKRFSLIQHLDSIADGDPLPTTYTDDVDAARDPRAPDAAAVVFAQIDSGRSIDMKSSEALFRYQWGTITRHQEILNTVIGSGTGGGRALQRIRFKIKQGVTLMELASNLSAHGSLSSFEDNLTRHRLYLIWGLFGTVRRPSAMETDDGGRLEFDYNRDTYPWSRKCVGRYAPSARVW